MGIEVLGSRDDAIREVLLARLGGAYRVAACILRDPLAAEDAVQEAALRAWDRRGELRDLERAEAWFGRIVVNTCRSELARRSKQPPAPEPDSMPGPLETAELRDEVGCALARLSPDEQLLLAMRYGRDLTVPQIATQTGQREGTVKSRLHSAHEHFRAALAAEERLGETWR